MIERGGSAAGPKPGAASSSEKLGGDSGFLALLGRAAPQSRARRRLIGMIAFIDEASNCDVSAGRLY
jgi:hypothetical protein